MGASFKANKTTHAPPEISNRASNQRQRWLKQLQLILGPRLATRKNLLLFIAFLQTIAILLLCLALKAKYHAIQQLRLSPARSPRTPHGAVEKTLGNPPAEGLTKEGGPSTSVAASKTTSLSPIRRFGLFTSSQPCKPQPCTIDHWSASEESCFFRVDRAKDRRGHNATVWGLVQNEWYYSETNDFACPAVLCRKQWLSEFNLTTSLAINALGEHYKNDTEWELVDLVVQSTYMRVNPFWGLEYKLNGLITLKSHNDVHASTKYSKRASVTLRRGFTQKFCDVALDDNILPEEDPVYVIVPYTGRADMLRKFYVNVKSLLDAGVNLRIILSVFGEVHVQGARLILHELEFNITVGNLSEGNIIQIVQSPGDFHGSFSRFQALHEGSIHAPADGLLFFCDVDVEIRKEFFDNCRYNTEKNHKVYYPVLYSLYPYGNAISKEHGYWRNGAFGMLCVYNSDLTGRKAWSSSSREKVFLGWGMEDVALYKEFSNIWQYTIFRSVEPNLLHRWHSQVCDFNANVAACLDTVLQNLGTQAFLASVIANHGIDVRKEGYTPEPIYFEEYKNDTAGSDRRKLEIPVPESVTDMSKLKQLQSFYLTGIQKSNRDRMLRYLSENVLDMLAKATG